MGCGFTIAGASNVVVRNLAFDGSGTRHPRVRFGNPVHAYNNLYAGNQYGVASTMGAGVLVEANRLFDVEERTLVGYADSGPGTLVQRNNSFLRSGTPGAAGAVAPIPHAYASTRRRRWRRS